MIGLSLADVGGLEYGAVYGFVALALVLALLALGARHERRLYQRATRPFDHEGEENRDHQVSH